MKIFFVFCFLLFVFLFVSCSNKKNTPDVSEIKVQLNVQRFDEDFFAIDTNNISSSLDNLQKKYPLFINDFLYNIMALQPQQDSVIKGLKLFFHDYKKVYDSAQIKFKSFDKNKNEIEHGLQFVKYYFPNYEIPSNIVTFIGPIEGYGNVLTASGFAVGLQLYLGKNFPAYHTDYIMDVYPEYQSRRFEPEYIPVNCMRNIIDDMHPDKSGGKNLIEQMIEEGKRLYVLDHLLPETADTLKTGYTKNQLDGCYENEAGIWNYFIENNLIYITDPMQIRDYVSDATKTEGLGEASPGNIGLFIGWQIVKKWMAQNEKKTLDELMQTSSKQIFDEAKYKPR
ncbi:MAG: hypothetical protein ACR2FN_09650 [Chitinophagaceae bacterium]